MLLPVLVAFQLLWRLVVDRSAPWPPWLWLVAGALALACVLVVRYAALGGLGAYSTLPAVAQMWDNYVVGARIGFFVKPTDRWYLWPWAEWFTLAVLTGGLFAALWRPRAPPTFLLLAGAIGAAIVDLPFVFVTKPEQYHLIASFSVVSITTGLLLIAWLVGHRCWRATIAAAAIAGLLVLAAAARHRGALYTPYTPWTLGHDEIVIGWASVPLEIRDWLREGLRTRRQPAVGPLSRLPAIVFGASDFEDGPGARKMRWIGERTVILPGPHVRALDVPLMAFTPVGAARFQVVIDSPEGRIAAIALREGESVAVRVPLRDRPTLFPLSRRVTVTVTPTWRMCDVVKGSTDRRALTVRLGDVRAFTR